MLRTQSSVITVLISHTDEGLIGKFYPEYHFSSRVAPSQLKKPRGMKSDMRGKIFWLNPSKGVWYHHYLRFDREHQCDATAKQMHSKIFTQFLFFKLAMIFWEMATSRRNSSHGKSVSLWLNRKSICRLHWRLLTGLVVWQCICGWP